MIPLLRVTPLVGRTFTDAEDSPKGPNVVLISEGLWRSRFGADRNVLGRTLEVNGRSRDYAARYAPFAYADDPDFNVKSFRTTNVLRWEYKPGSTLFVVWQQARENDAVPGGFRLGRDVHDIFGVTPRNVFLVKLAYLLNY